MIARSVLFALAALLVAAPVGAQDLAEARRLAQQGQVDSARALLTRLLAATPPTDTLYPEILYTQGGLAPSTTEMQRAYGRVALEYPNSPWADDAILRLAQIEFAVNDYRASLRQVERLRTDYPASPLLGLAALWGARAHFATNNVTAGCVMLADGLARAGDDVELRNQLEYYRGRCAPTVAGDGRADAQARGRTEEPAPGRVEEPVQEPAPAEPPVSAPGRPRAGWTVQLAALGSRATADELLAAVRRAGYDGLIVTEGGLHKVRAGPWAGRDEAARALEALRARFGGQPFLVRP